MERNYVGKMVKEENAGVVFRFTPEILDAIVAGLLPEANDRVLSIAGCGDQALALAEFGSKVTIVDYNQSQINFVQSRIDAIKKDDFFSAMHHSPRSTVDMEALLHRIPYFRGRFEQLRKNIENIELLPATGLEDITQKKTFTKIYTSDAVNEIYNENDHAYTLQQLANGLEINGLIYLSNGAEIRNLTNRLEELKPIGLIEREDLSKVACKLEHIYGPLILQKVR